MRTTLHEGNHLLNSLYQFPSVDLGAKIKWGPLMFLYSLINPSIAIVWIVFPNPISSASIPLSPNS